MANDLNRCDFIGRLGKDPEAKQLPNGDCVVNFSLAVGWKSKDKDGVEWVNVVAFRKLAEIISQYCLKGQQIYISGNMRTRKWADRDGNDRYSTEIVANNFQFLGSKSDGQRERPAENSSGYGKSQPHHTEDRATGGGGDFCPPDDFDDQIPFLFPHEYRELK